MTIGEKIKAYRSIFKLTQKELAELSGVSEISIRKYEAGERNPKLEQIRKIAQALRLPEEEFFEIQYKETTDVKTVGDVMSILLLLEEKVGIEYFYKHHNRILSSAPEIEPDTLTIRFKDERINESLAEWIARKTFLEETTDRFKFETRKWELPNPIVDEKLALLMTDREGLRKAKINDDRPLSSPEKKK